MIDVEGHCGLVEVQPRVACQCDFVIQVMSSPLWNAGRYVNKKQQQRRADVRSFHCPSGTIQTILLADCLSSAPAEYLLYNTLVH
jgi:hypothetical protein